MRIKQFIGELKSFDDEARVIEAVISTEEPDRDGDIVRADGWELDKFRKNPVVLFAHNYSELPVGRCVDIKVEDGKLIAKTEFAPTPLGRQLYDLYKNGFMRAWSVGFNPIEWREIRDESGKLTGYEFIKQELLEYSAVPVPANPNALTYAYKALAEATEDVGKGNKDEGDDEDGVIKGVVPFKEFPVLDTDDWDADAVEQKVRKWASSDGSGDKDKIDWAKYRLAFGWYDEDNPENFTSYAYLHHNVKDGKLYTDKRGVQVAMNFLLRIRGGRLSEDERKKLYNHLAKHYKQWGGEPPDFKGVMSLDVNEIVELLATIESRLKELAEGVEKLAERVEGVVKDEGEQDEVKQGEELDKEALVEMIEEKIKKIFGGGA